MSSAESSLKRAATVPAGTVTEYFLVSASATGAVLSKAPVVTLSCVGVTPTSPSTVEVSVPVVPGVTEYDCVPLALAAPCTSVGALRATGRTATGIRTSCVLSLQVSDPVA